MKNMTLRKAFELIWLAKTLFSNQDFINIWGEHLGNHIWWQEGNDIIKIWRCGLTKIEQDKLIEYIEKEFKID